MNFAMGTAYPIFSIFLLTSLVFARKGHLLTLSPRFAKMKYVLVSGGVISGVGKGIIASSCGLLLKTAGLSVSSIKIDPYLNPDAGLMNVSDLPSLYYFGEGMADCSFVL